MGRPYNPAYQGPATPQQFGAFGSIDLPVSTGTFGPYGGPISLPSQMGEQRDRAVQLCKKLWQFAQTASDPYAASRARTKVASLMLKYRIPAEEIVAIPPPVYSAVSGPDASNANAMSLNPGGFPTFFGGTTGP